MNDRTLLELAARAACERWITDQKLCQGSDISLFRLERNGELVSLHALLCEAYQAGQVCTDDGDALRLAVTCGLVVTPDRENQRTLVSNQAGHEYCAIYWDKLGEMAATRLAITEAAAEIGKSMGVGE
ncbi:hypothetical protein KK198_16145 [Pseudomonas aeruginosa]|uniref:hypothetical protein n=1 Tax=Pseudomonas aeruginosa TaxID=287 RepID=UPI001912423F|nr:hypothetical protein [Pseudomonas aeruginosa]WCV82398.1 hypothetical protein KK198_16145 [Pseudomonas aeruginosa]